MLLLACVIALLVRMRERVTVVVLCVCVCVSIFSVLPSHAFRCPSAENAVKIESLFSHAKRCVLSTDSNMSTTFCHFNSNAIHVP